MSLNQLKMKFLDNFFSAANLTTASPSSKFHVWRERVVSLHGESATNRARKVYLPESKTRTTPPHSREAKVFICAINFSNACTQVRES